MSSPTLNFHKIQNGSIIRVAENGEEVLILENESGKINLTAGVLDNLIERIIDQIEEGLILI